MTTQFTQPKLIKRLQCLLFGHQFLFDGYIKDKTTPTLQNFIYDETETNLKTVGLTFCPRCYGFSGIHFLEEKVKKKDLESSKGLGLTNKKKKKK